MRVKLAANEVDHNYRVENAIAEQLKEGHSAEISLPSIEAYQVLDMEDGGVIKPAIREDRLNQIVAVIRERFDLHEVEYQIAGDDVQFRQRRRPR